MCPVELFRPRAGTSRRTWPLRVGGAFVICHGSGNGCGEINDRRRLLFGYRVAFGQLEAIEVVQPSELRVTRLLLRQLALRCLTRGELVKPIERTQERPLRFDESADVFEQSFLLLRRARAARRAGRGNGSRFARASLPARSSARKGTAGL